MKRFPKVFFAFAVFLTMTGGSAAWAADEKVTDAKKKDEKAAEKPAKNSAAPAPTNAPKAAESTAGIPAAQPAEKK